MEKLDFKMKVGQESVRLKELNPSKDVFGALVNNRLRELDYILRTDAEIEFIDKYSIAGTRIYETTLRYVILKAIKNITGNNDYIIQNSISRSFLLISSDESVCLEEDFLKEVQKEVERLIKLDLPIVRKKISTEEAKKIFNDFSYKDKLNLLQYRSRTSVNVYECDGYVNYLYGYMLPSTGYLNEFRLKLHNPGILITYPRSDVKGKIPDFEESITYDKELLNSSFQAKQLALESVKKINTFIEKKGEVDLINISENIHNRQLVYLGDEIERNINKIKLISVAGPSSSGKTTFTNKLRLELLSRGITPLTISIDNYYKHPSLAPLDEFGKPDLESIHALDIERFNSDISALINGKNVELRTYDFKTQTSKNLEAIKIGKNTVIIIEGIHALNDELTTKISRLNKYKIYICPIIPINLDDHNAINVTDFRLIRRIVRDKHFRNTSPEKTFSMWQSVRNGEFKSIYPYTDTVDFVFNSGLYYELSVMKEFAIEALNEIKEDNEYYIEANRLLKFLRYIKTIDTKNVPCNSIIREFIGGSSFEEGKL